MWISLKILIPKVSEAYNYQTAFAWKGQNGQVKSRVTNHLRTKNKKIKPSLYLLLMRRRERKQRASLLQAWLFKKAFMQSMEISW